MPKKNNHQRKMKNLTTINCSHEGYNSPRSAKI